MNKNRLRRLLDYDPDTGRLAWKPRSPQRIGGRVYTHSAWNAEHAGKPILGMVLLDGRYYDPARVAWAWMHGVMPRTVTRINGDKGDIRAVNLKASTNNRKPRGTYPGVTWDKRAQQWKAQVWQAGKNKFLGRYDTPEEAREAYIHATGDAA
jgi:hypothetical protein